MRRQIRTVLSLLKPGLSVQRDIKTSNSQRDVKVRMFKVGDKVMVRNYSGRKKWLIGNIVKVLGSLHYLVDIEGKSCKKHVDQIREMHEVVATDRSSSMYDLCDLVFLEGAAGGEQSEVRGPPQEIRLPVRSTRGQAPRRLNL